MKPVDGYPPAPPMPSQIANMPNNDVRLMNSRVASLINGSCLELSLASYIDLYLAGDDHRFFFTSALKHFTLTIIPDEQNASKQEPDYGTVLPLSFAAENIKDVRDVAAHYMHLMCHKKCDELWITCPVHKGVFKQHEVDFIEEMYNQRILSVVCPDLCGRFATMFQQYDKFMKFAHPDMRAIMNSVLSVSGTSHLLQPELRALHKRIYAQDPMARWVFTMYIQDWKHLILKSGFRDILAHYMESNYGK